jgi:hypothetical protein
MDLTVAYNCNLATWEAETDDLSSRSAQAKVSQTLSQKIIRLWGLTSVVSATQDAGPIMGLNWRSYVKIKLRAENMTQAQCSKFKPQYKKKNP